MSCDVGEATENLDNQNELWRRWSDKALRMRSAHSPRFQWSDKAWRMRSAHSPRFQSLHLRHSSFWLSKLSVASSTSQLILQPFPRFTYVTTHFPTLPLLHLRHNSFSNPSVASPTSQLILQPFFRFSYVTGFSLKSPGEPPMTVTQSMPGKNSRLKLYCTH